MVSGFLNIAKPVGVSSRKAVDAIGRRLRKLKLGHCGTLDPLADGTLIVAVGQACRLVELVHELPKSYTALLRLGATSATDDGEGPIRETPDAKPATQAEAEAALARFVGPLEQIPPAFSAVRREGKYAYQLTRRGEAPILPPRPIIIHAIELLRFAWPRLELMVDCGKGTYIRSLARDVGQALGCGAYLAALTRTRIGPFRLEEALPLEAATKEDLLAKLVPIPAALAHLRNLELSPEQLKRMQHGVPVPLTPAIEAAGSPVLLTTPGDKLLILAKIDTLRRCLKPEKVLSCF